MVPSKRNHVRQSLGEILGLSEKKPLCHEIGETSAAAAAADVVAVCVDNDSEPAVEMALNRLVFEGDHLKLIHVRHPIVAVPSPLGIYMPIAQVSSEVVAAHVQKVASETLDMLRSFQQMCNRKKVQAENIVLEDHNIPKAILKYISNSRVNKLVLMSSHPLIRRKLKGDDMPKSDAMKASKFCSIYVVSKAKLASSKTKLAPVHPGNISPQNRRSCSLRSTLLSSEMTGKRVYKPNETTTDDENGNQSIENSRRDFEENGNQSSENNQSTENSRKDSEENGNQSFENNQSTENSSKDSEDNGNQSLENNQSTENSSKDSEENGNQIFENNQSTENSSKDSEENGNQSLENNQSTENSGKDSEENGNQIFENNQSTENNSKDSEENGSQIFENNQSTENSSKDSEESGNQSENSSREFEENGNQSFRRDFKKIGNRSFENIIRDFEGPFVSKHNIGSKLERLKSDLIQNTSETYRDAFAFEEAVAAKYKETKDAFILADKRCKGYSIEQIEFATHFFSESLKIGEGGYGPVYKGSLEHTTVAIKVLGKDAARGRDEIEREIEVLSRIRHPNIVVLLGMCPAIGCIVYEYMDNCSLEEQLFHRGSGTSLPWFIRFRIASEIASALHFLHTTKPKPYVHCDLKPANILLDHNFVSKIGDVGIASLVSPTVSCAVTDNKNSVSYMDPEYVRTGTLSPMSDLYALGIILLQLLTGKRPVALTTKVQTAILKGSFNKILDKTAGGWPLEETLDFAKLALKCTEFLRRDRPDLETLVLPKLERFKDLAPTYAKHCTS